MPAPKKDEQDKVVSLSGFTVIKRDMDYIKIAAEIKRVTDNAVVRDMVAEYRERHHISSIYKQREEQIRNEELQLNMDRARYENAKTLAEARINDFIKANDGFKFYDEKALSRTMKAFKNSLEKELGLLTEDIDEIYDRTLQAYFSTKEKQ